MSDEPLIDQYSKGYVLGEALLKHAGLEKRPKVGDPDHPLNVEKIRTALGCIPNLCRVTVEYDYLMDSYIISHKVPPHEVIYKVHPISIREPLILDQFIQHQWHGLERRIEAYYFERYADEAEKLVRHLMEDMCYQINKAMPRHA